MSWRDGLLAFAGVVMVGLGLRQRSEASPEASRPARATRFTSWADPQIAEAPASSAPSRDVDIVARTIWGEARGEGPTGMQAVANVIMNRVSSSRWPDSPAAVALQAYQFSAWNEGDPNRARVQAVTEADPAFREALKIARAAVAGSLPDITGGADHYFAPAVVSPSWASAMTATGDIGRHRFMRA